MNKIHAYPYMGTPFRVECSTVENDPGTWDSTKISIFKDNNLIGEYLRNYSSFGAMTFYPFEIDSQWYALYSANYTASRVMKLHNDKIEDWCGEDANSNGFCPVEFYVPRFKESFHTMTVDNGTHDFSCYYFDTEYKTHKEFVEEEIVSISPIVFRNTNFGFMCGCHWGDDSTWKIRYIDLSKVPEKQLIIEERFGYWEMPRSLTLKQSIDMRSWEPEHQLIELIKSEFINLNV